MRLDKCMSLCYMAYMTKRDESDKTEEQLSERVIIPMAPSMVEAIQNYRFINRLESRAEAVRKLIEIGLASDKSSKPKK